jgi:MinD-like ATPase involved in chromosome partitioning or flagellar assembly
VTQIIAVHSFRGGTGKSNLLANLSVKLAQSGQRIGIVDTDIQSPGIHVLFGFDKAAVQYSLNDYLWSRCTIQETSYDVSSVLGAQEALEEPQGKLYLIPSSVRAGEIARIIREGYDVRRLRDGFQELIDLLKLDCLMIDTHPGLNEETLLSIAIADALVVVLRPDRQDYQGTAVTVDVARKLEVAKMFLVVNKVLSGFDTAAVQEQVERTYQAPVAGVLPLSEEMIQLASSDIFCLRYPDHPLSQKVDAIAQQLSPINLVARPLVGKNHP